MLKSNKKDNFIWACDMSQNTGEGQLARLFLNKEKIKINKYSQHKIKNQILSFKYLFPFIGLFYCWFNFFKKKKIYYINYLPLWNFLIFLLLPPKTIIGPITGGANFKFSFIRKYIFPILYLISQIIIYFRYNYIYFSTSLLKKKLFFFIKKKSCFNYVLHALNKKQTIKKKNIDFLIYYRNHKNKKSLFPYLFLNKIIKLGFSVNVVGDKLNCEGVKNYGKLTNSKINKYLSRTKFSIASGENLLSFFTLECINNNVKILIDKSQRIEIKNLKKNFVKLNYNSDKLEQLFVK
jgi:hypothetical protein